MIGEHEAIGREHKAGALAAPRLNAGDGGRHALDGVDHRARVRIEQEAVLRALRNGFRHDADRTVTWHRAHHPFGWIRRRAACVRAFLSWYGGSAPCGWTLESPAATIRRPTGRSLRGRRVFGGCSRADASSG